MNNGLSIVGRVFRLLEVPVLILVPLMLAFAAWLNIDQTALLTIVVVLLCLVVFFASFETSKPSLRSIMPIVVLAALAAAGRIIFGAIPDVKPVTAICILTGVVFGKRSGFMVGALAALTSNFFFGQGLWTPWQMYAWGLIGYLAGVFQQAGLFKHQPVVYVCGFLAPLLYGLLLNGFYVVGYIHPITWPAIVAAYAAGLPLDLVHSVATVAFLLVLYAPWRRKLERIKAKYELAF